MLLTKEHTEAFAAASGDRNAVHFDADYARACKIGRPCAHGVTAVLAALREWASNRRFSLTRIRANFYQPTFYETNYALNILVDGNLVRIVSTLAETSIFEVEFIWSEPEREEVWPTSDFLATSRAYSPDSAALDKFLKLVGLNRGQMPWLQLSALLWCSHLNGMGESTKNGVCVSFEFAFSPTAFDQTFRVDDLLEHREKRFNATVIEARAKGISFFRAHIHNFPVLQVGEE